jgi:hypothetical protein
MKYKVVGKIGLVDDTGKTVCESLDIDKEVEADDRESARDKVKNDIESNNFAPFQPAVNLMWLHVTISEIK